MSVLKSDRPPDMDPQEYYNRRTFRRLADDIGTEMAIKTLWVAIGILGVIYYCLSR